MYCFDFSAIMNNASRSIHAQFFGEIMFSFLLSIIPRSRMQDHVVTLLKILKTCQTVFYNKLHHFSSSSAVYKDSVSQHSHQHSFLLYAAAAKSLQSCPTLCDPIDSSVPGSAVPGILQARTLEWVAISFPMHESEKSK